MEIHVLHMHGNNSLLLPDEPISSSSFFLKIINNYSN